MYQQPNHDYTEFRMTNGANFQVLDIQIRGKRRLYPATISKARNVRNW
jgi:hypothetical protein